MENEHRPPRTNWLRRFGLLCIVAGSLAVAAYGQTPLAAFGVLGGIIVLIEPYLTRRGKVS